MAFSTICSFFCILFHCIYDWCGYRIYFLCIYLNSIGNLFNRCDWCHSCVYLNGRKVSSISLCIMSKFSILFRIDVVYTHAYHYALLFESMYSSNIQYFQTDILHYIYDWCYKSIQLQLMAIVFCIVSIIHLVIFVLLNFIQYEMLFSKVF